MARAYRLLLGIWALLWSLFIAFVVGTVAVLPFVVIPRRKREGYTVVGTSLFAKLVVKYVLFVKLTVTEVAKPKEEGMLIVCNHRSWLDPLLMMWFTKSGGLAKKEVKYLPVFGFYGWLGGAVFVDRTSLHNMHLAKQQVLGLLKANHRVHVFPEGTRSEEGHVRQRVQLNLVRDCYLQNIPVRSCAVKGTRAVLPQHEKTAYFFVPVSLYLGHVHRPEQYGDVESFCDAVWQETLEHAIS